MQGKLRQQTLSFDITTECACCKTPIHIKSDIRETVAALKSSSDQHAQLDIDQVTDALFLLVEGAMTTGRIYRDTWPFRAARQAAEALLS